MHMVGLAGYTGMLKYDQEIAWRYQIFYVKGELKILIAFDLTVASTNTADNRKAINCIFHYYYY